MMDLSPVVAMTTFCARLLGNMIEPSMSREVLLARREARVVATAIDLTILGIVGALFAALGGLAVLLQTDWLAVDPSRGELVWGGVVAGLWLVLPPLYFAAGSWRWGTVGSRQMGLETRRYEGHGQIGSGVNPARAALRAVLFCGSFPIVGLGLLVGVFHPEGRALHDVASRTAMVERGTSDEGPVRDAEGNA